MVFNSNSDNQDIVSLTLDLVNGDTNAYSLKSIARASNARMREIWTWIFDAYGGWRYDDSNYTDLPEATTDLTSGTASYALPTTTTFLRGIDIKDSAGTNWLHLTPITLEEILTVGGEGSFMSTSSTPVYYRLVGSTFKLYPTPNYTSSNGIKVFFDRDISAFASTDTTKTPGFDSPFHELVAIGAALTFAQRKSLVNKNDLLFEWQRGEQRVRDYYSKRFAELFPPSIKVRDVVYDAT